MNYLSIHKNKRPKSIRRRSKRYIGIAPMIAVTAAITVAQIQVVRAQDGMTATQRQVELFKTVVNGAEAIIGIMAKEKQQRFKQTGRYT